MKKITLYTDGACAFNPGPGGWGAILNYDGNEKTMSGFEDNTTNNKMELTAVIEGLNAINEKCEVDVYTDSAYVFNAFNDDWISGWIAKGWKNSNKKPVANKDLWQKLILLTQFHKVTFHKVLGHADNELNNRCDELARGEVDRFFEQHPERQAELEEELANKKLTQSFENLNADEIKEKIKEYKKQIKLLEQQLKNIE